MAILGQRPFCCQGTCFLQELRDQLFFQGSQGKKGRAGGQEVDLGTTIMCLYSDSYIAFPTSSHSQEDSRSPPPSPRSYEET